MRNSPSNAKRRDYDYYVCKNKDCPAHNRGVRTEGMHRAFVQILSAFHISDLGTSNIWALFEEELALRLKQNKQRNSKLSQQIQNVEKRLDGYVDTLAQTALPQVIERVKGRICDAGDEIQALEQRREPETLEEEHRTALYSRVMALFTSLGDYWDSATYAERRQLQESLLFGVVHYSRDTGITIEKMCPLFSQNGGQSHE